MIKLTLVNGKTIMVGANHIQAALTGSMGGGAMIVLGGSLTYDVRESTDEISALLAAHEKATAEV